MDDKNRAKAAQVVLEGALTKLKNADENGVLLTMEESVLLVAWLKTAGLVK